nr:right-handed parallel beta-helix repeat-containing protein [uncultured Methanobrevibacter sp.]
MKKLYKLSLLLVAIMILTMSAASAADTNDMADVISEEESNSLELDESLSEAEASGNDDVLADDGTTFSSLQDEIDGGGNSVTLTKNYTRIDSDNDINITKDITIDGKNEYKIDADKKGRIFDIKNAEVTLIGITFENGKINPDYGGIICANNSKLTIINCTFYNFFNYNRNSNYVGWGGAISAINCDSLTVDNCKFIFSSYDTTAAYGGAIYSNNTKNNIIKNSRFTGMAAAEDGGAIYIINSDGTNTIYNCEIYDNQAGNNNGGGLYAQNLNITVDKCYFHDNSMRGKKGAAIFFEDGIINLTNSKFENNDLNGALQSISISGDSLLIVKNNTQQMYDITVLEENAFTQIKNVTILENKTIRPTSNSVTLTAVVLDVDGNKIFDTRFKYTVDGEKLDYTYNPYIKNYNYKYTIPAEKKLYTISMDYNTTAYPSSFPPLEDFDIFTGAIDKTPVKGTYTDLQSQIYATPEGGVLNLPYNFTYNLEADGDNFPNGVILNKTITINGNGYSISGNNSKRVFYVDQTDLSIKLNNITFINGNATDGGAIYTYDSNWYSIDVFIDSCTFINNTASVDGGAICMAQGSYNFTVNKCTFINNTASTTNGGAIYYGGDGNELYLTDSIFEGNAANGLANSLYVTSSYVYLENNKINKTFAEIVFDGSYTNKANITVLENKSVFVNGGETVQLNATVTDNEGNLIYNEYNEITVNGQTITTTAGYEKYTAEYTMPTTIVTYPVSLTNDFKIANEETYKNGEITNTVPGTYTDLQTKIDATPDGGVLNLPYNFTYNLGVDADKFPNGVILNKAITINGNGFTISGNNSKRIFILEKEVKINLNDITFANGNATEGGAVYLGWEYDDVNITNCIFENNTAVEGGAIFNGYHYINVDSCTFKNNTATENGGAIFIQGDGENKTIKNSKFEDNNATKGKSIYIDCADVYFENNIVNTKEAEIAINARIMTEVTATVLEGQKIKVKGGDKVQLNATLTDDNGNLIYLINQDMLKFTVSDADSTEIVVQEQDYTKYSANYTVPFETGNYTVSMKEDTSSGWVNLPNLTVINATLENDVPPVPGTYTDLQAKINKLKDGEVLNLTYDFAYNQEIDGDRFPEGVVINKNIIINGNGFTISGNNSKRVFKIGDGSAEINVNLNNITFANGNSSDNGGAIYSAPKTSIAIDNCNFTNNLAETGGAIYSASANTNITNSKFENNIAKAGSQSNAALFDESKVYLDKNTINKDQAEIYLSKSALLSKSNVTVMGNETITAASPNVNLTAVIYDDSGNLIYDDSVDFTVTQIDGNYKKEIKAEAGSANYNATDVLPGLGTYLISMKSNVDSDLIFNNIKTAIIEYKAETKINVTVDGDSTYPNATVTITTNADGNYTVKIGNTTKVVELKANTPTVVNVNGATPGDNQVVNVTFHGTGAYYSAVNDTETINIKKATPKLNVTVNKENYPNDVHINVTSDVDGKVEVKVGNVTKIVDVKAGVTQEVIIDNANVGDNQLVNVTYIENENCTSAFNDTNKVNIKKYTPKINVTMNSDEYPASINVTSDVTGEYTIKVGNITKKVKLEKGKPQMITLEGLAPSETPYKVNVTSDENPDYYASFNDTVEIKVAKGTPILEVATEEVNHYPNVVVNITSDANGTVNVTIHLDDGKSVTKQVNVTAGETVSVPFEGISPSKTEDGYLVEATYLENDMYNSVTEPVPLHVYPANATLNVTADAVQGENSTITIKVPENATGNVTVTIDGKNYTGTIKNGTATITGPVLPSGDTPVNVTYTSDTPNYSSKTVPATIHVKSVDTDVKDMKRGWNSPYDYQTTLIDENGKGIAGRNITITVNGKQYNVTTDSNGVAKLTQSKLDVGQYNVTVTNPVTGQNKTAKITIVARILENKDLTKDYEDPNHYTVLAIGDDGNAAGAGEIVVIETNGVKYKIKTDAKGHATLPIHLIPKKYDISATYKGYTVKNKLTVKQVMKVASVKIKKTAKKLVLKATLKYSNGKAIKGKVIKLKFRGKTYKAKTDSKGVAKVTVKKNVIQKLKKGKKYTILAIYIHDNVKGKVTVRK